MRSNVNSSHTYQGKIENLVYFGSATSAIVFQNNLVKDIVNMMTGAKPLQILCLFVWTFVHTIYSHTPPNLNQDIMIVFEQFSLGRSKSTTQIYIYMFQVEKYIYRHGAVRMTFLYTYLGSGPYIFIEEIPRIYLPLFFHLLEYHEPAGKRGGILGRPPSSSGDPAPFEPSHDLSAKGEWKVKVGWFPWQPYPVPGVEGHA